MDFETVWLMIQKNLDEGNVLPRWTKDSGYIPNPVSISRLGNSGVQITTPSAGAPIYVAKSEFAKVWSLWGGYLAGTVRRNEIASITHFSAYVISIFHSLSLFWGLEQPSS